jgi:hypothetical protein
VLPLAHTLPFFLRFFNIFPSRLALFDGCHVFLRFRLLQ